MTRSNLNPLLKSVSRSFYLSLRVLPSDLRAAMGLGYLLCRAADTVADTAVLAPADRLALLSDIRSAFDVFPLPPARAQVLVEKIKSGVSGPTTAERELLERYQEGLDALLALPKTDQALVQRVVVAVVKGMEMDLTTFGASEGENVKDRPVVALANEDALERYLEWIGGAPGVFWTDLSASHRTALQPSLAALRNDALRFGTGLQLINILRDLRADLRNGRCYIPATRLAAAGLSPEDLRSPRKEDVFLPLYHELIDSAVDRLRAGYTYVAALPRTMLRLRAAVWWPLVIGLRTLALLREASTVLGETATVKVARKEMYWLLLTSGATLPFNRLLRADFDDLAAAAASSSGL